MEGGGVVAIKFIIKSSIPWQIIFLFLFPYYNFLFLFTTYTFFSLSSSEDTQRKTDFLNMTQPLNIFLDTCECLKKYFYFYFN